MKDIYDYYRFSINELLYHTLDPNSAERKIYDDLLLIRRDGLVWGEIVFEHHDGQITIHITNHKYTKDQIMAVLCSIYATGYFVARFGVSTPRIQDRIILKEDEFLKLFDPDSKKRVVRFSFQCEPRWGDPSIIPPPTLYHIAPTSRIPKIIRTGLQPRSSGARRASHPNRLYLCMNQEDTLPMARRMSFSDFVSRRYTGGHDLLAVDTTGLNTTFYQDPHSTGVYTYDNIPPEKIINLGRILDSSVPKPGPKML